MAKFTAEEVISWMELDLPADDRDFALIIPAVEKYVDSLPSIDKTPDGAWAGTTKLGAIMLAGRLYNRKNSPAGTNGVGELTTYISRYDSDISRLLNIDSFTKPVVA